MKAIISIFLISFFFSCSNSEDSINCGVISGSKYTINDSGVETFAFIVDGENIEVSKAIFYGFNIGELYCW